MQIFSNWTDYLINCKHTYTEYASTYPSCAIEHSMISETMAVNTDYATLVCITGVDVITNYSMCNLPVCALPCWTSYAQCTVSRRGVFLVSSESTEKTRSGIETGNKRTNKIQTIQSCTASYTYCTYISDTKSRYST